MDFKHIFDDFYPKVYGFALKACGQEWLAEEIAHNVFCKLWTHRNNLNIKGKSEKEVYAVVSSYLFTISRNEVNDYWRDCKQIESLRENLVSDLCAESRVEQNLDARGALGIVDRVVSLMPPVRREVFSLSRFHNIPNEQIARRLHISKRTVEKHINLALKELRVEIAAYQM